MKGTSPQQIVHSISTALQMFTLEGSRLENSFLKKGWQDYVFWAPEHVDKQRITRYVL